MRFSFSDTRRPARVSKLVRSAFAAAGNPIGLTRARDVCARLYGYATFHELAACAGRGTPSAWDERVPAEVAAGRRARQVASLVADGLHPAAAARFVDETRPTGTARRPRAATSPATDPSGSPVPIDVLERLRILISAETEATLYVGSDGPHDAVEDALHPHYPGKQVRFVAFDEELFQEFLTRTRLSRAGYLPVSILDRFERRVYTAEEPTEFRIPVVGEIRIESGDAYTFSRAIRNHMSRGPFTLPSRTAGPKGDAAG